MAILKNTTIDDTGFINLPAGNTAQRPLNPQAGYMRFNTDYSIREVYNGTNWVNTVNGLTIGLGLSSSSPAPSAKQIKTATPSAVSGLFWIRPPGLTTAQQVFCDMETMGGGWMHMMYNHGGPQHGTNTNFYNLINNVSESNTTPFVYGGTKGFGKSHHFNYHKDVVGIEIMKTYASYNSANTRLNLTDNDSGLGTGGGADGLGNLFSGRADRIVADRLDCGEAVSFIQITGTSAAGASPLVLDNVVTLFLDNGLVPGSRCYGSTRNIIRSGSNRGFANYQNPEGSEPYMLWWAGRHWITYRPDITDGIDANRCQYRCYGTEDLWIENAWFIREKAIAR